LLTGKVQAMGGIDLCKVFENAAVLASCDWGNAKGIWELIFYFLDDLVDLLVGSRAVDNGGRWPI